VTSTVRQKTADNSDAGMRGGWIAIWLTSLRFSTPLFIL
jgi:hypothetical protein